MEIYQNETFLAALPDQAVLSAPLLLMSVSEPEAVLAQEAQTEGRLLEETFDAWNRLARHVHEHPATQHTPHSRQWDGLEFLFHSSEDANEPIKSLVCDVQIVSDGEQSLDWEIRLSDGTLIGQGTQIEEAETTSGQSTLHLDHLNEALDFPPGNTWTVSYSWPSQNRELTQAVTIRNESDLARWATVGATHLGWLGVPNFESLGPEPAWIIAVHFGAGRAEGYYTLPNEGEVVTPDFVECWDINGVQQWAGTGEDVPEGGLISECAAPPIGG